MSRRTQCFCINCGKPVNKRRLRLVPTEAVSANGLSAVRMQYEYRCPDCGTESIFNQDIINEEKAYE